MNKLNKILSNIMILIMIVLMFIKGNCNINIASNLITDKTIKADVLLYDFNDIYLSTVRTSLEQIEKENAGKIEFKFFDANNDQLKENQIIDDVIQTKPDILLVNLVDTSENASKIVIDKIKENNIPVIFFNREPISKDVIKSYEKAIILSTEIEKGGQLQGKILAELWNKDKSNIDKNKDNVMQYIMLKGDNNDLAANARTKYSIDYIEKSGIKTEQIALKVCNWNEKEAEEAVQSLLSKYGSKIEAIISNNDSMAQGAIKALQKQGYNQGDKSKMIPIVGVDATKEAKDLIKKGYMTGTVFQDPNAEAKALYTLAKNLVEGKNPIINTDYKFDETGITIRMPYKEYVPN